MMRKPTIQRLMFLFSIAGLVAVTADFACLEDVCADLKTAEFRTMEDIQKNRVESLDEALGRQGVTLTSDQRARLGADGHLFGVVKLERPVKHPDGALEMPKGWLPELTTGHPWGQKLSPADDAYYSWFEERVVKAKLFDPQNPEHMRAADAYLAKSRSNSPEFLGWTYATRTECMKIKYDAKGTSGSDALPFMVPP